jgi:aryl-alcohol dehydrogenase-like predicted oxidoreductase
MRYRKLGWTGWEVSELGLGTYPLGGALTTSGTYWNGPSTYGAVTSDEAIATIHTGLARGLTFIDTAPNYAEAEVFIGQALASRPGVPGVPGAPGAPGVPGAPGAPGAPGTAQERRCYVATKCGEHVRPVMGGAPELVRDFSRPALRESLARSRQRLGVSRLDVVFLHSPRQDELGEDPLGLLVELRDQGEIAHVGESAGSVQRAIDLIEHDGRAEVLEIAFNLLQPAAAARLFPLAAEHGTGIVVRTPLASGYLTGAITEDHVFGPDDHRSATPREQITRQVRRAQAFMWLVEEGVAASLPEAALRYILSFPAVSTIIAGAMRRAELEANLDAVEAGPLPGEALERIAATQRELGLLD